MAKIILVMIGGAFGSALRFIAGSAGSEVSVFVVNVIGSGLIGFFGKGLSVEMQCLICTGFLGGLTTFSSLNSNVWQMIQSGRYAEAFLYYLANIIIGMFALIIGFYISKNI